LVLIYESVTSSASVIIWLTLHKWTLNSLMNELLDDSSTTESINYASFYTSRQTDEKLLPPTVLVLVCFIRSHGNMFSEPLSSNGLFRSVVM
jgi:hypothetical protein